MGSPPAALEKAKDPACDEVVLKIVTLVLSDSFV